MAVEIEKAEVTFTAEAQGALQRSLLQLERNIRARAADHAIKSRGTPAEITASDIEIAYRQVMEPRSRDVFDESLERDRKHSRATSRLLFVSTMYAWFGIFVAAIAGIYPFIRPLLNDPATRLSVAVAIAGLLVSATSLALRALIKQRELIRKEGEDSRPLLTEVLRLTRKEK